MTYMEQWILSSILFVVDFVEGKAYPQQSSPLEFEDLGGNTARLFWRTTKNCFVTGRYVVLDSGFCVLKGLIQLRKKSFFAFDITKKRRYWTYMVPGKDMEDHFGGVEMGETDAIQGNVDDIIYNVWCKKEPIYMVRMMATGGRLFADDTCKESVRIWK